MAEATIGRESPSSQAEAADVLRTATAQGLHVRPRGGGTKLGWGRPSAEPGVELSTGGLDRIVEHNEGDLTAVLEAGVPVAGAQEAFAGAGQMLALDPPLGPAAEATIGGLVASADSGPRRHRYGAVRDLVLGATVALSDGTVARSGGKVIKNVAGYDLAKLFSGSFGTLGLILQVAVRLHPRPETTATAALASDDLDLIARAASVLSHSRTEKECLDVAFSEGSGRVLARFAGATARDQAEAALDELSGAGLESGVTEDDEELWARQRAAQRSADGVVIRVSGLQSRLAGTLRAAEREGASLVGRVAPGLSWLRLPASDAEEAVAAIERLRGELAPSPCVVLDAPEEVRRAVDPWGPGGSALELMRRVRARFDPAGTLNPGVFVGGI